MAMKRAPFTPTRMQEERDQDEGRKVTLRLNKQENADLEADMTLLDMGVDSACIKFLVNIGRHVIHGQIGDEQLRYLVSQKRTRYDGRKR